MSKKLVFEMSIYTDGDWRYDKGIFEGYTSKYFDSDVFEYTLDAPDDYTFKVRRTFDDIDKGFDKIVDILTELRASVQSHWNVDSIKEFFATQIESAKKKTHFWDDMDSNTEIYIEAKIVDNDSKPIKEVIFEDGSSLSL